MDEYVPVYAYLSSPLNTSESIDRCSKGELLMMFFG